MKWLSVKKYKPPFDTSVFIKDKNNSIGLAFLCPEYGWRDTWTEVCLKYCDNITHFCIPDPIEIIEIEEE
jgi:hypothetical protein